MIDVYDNVLEDHIAEFVDMEVKKMGWFYDYESVKNKPNKHWHIFAGESIEEIEELNYVYILSIDL